MSSEALLPWHATQYREFLKLEDQGRLAHAWLVSGVAGIGKLQFVRHLAQRLLCRQPAGDEPCGQCGSCHLFSKETHPDWYLLQPPKRLIVVDQIRDAIDFSSATSQRGGYKIVCIDPAEAMNLSAANALLKLLEEPPAGTLLFLLSQQPGLLLATLRSRCQQLKLKLPTQQEALAWLKSRGCSSDAESLLRKTGGAPLRALAMSETGLLAEHGMVMQCLQELLNGSTTAVQAARACEKFGIVAIMDTLLQGTKELSMHLQGGIALTESLLQPVADAIKARDLHRGLLLLHALHASHAKTRKVLLSSNNPNGLLVLEQVFGEWVTLGQRIAPARPRGAVQP